jgi:hypothetical protein
VTRSRKQYSPKFKTRLGTRSVVKESLTTADGGKHCRTKNRNPDVVISVGYRVRPQRDAESRRWATGVPKECILRIRAENGKRLRQLGGIAGAIRRLDEELETDQVPDVIESCTAALDMPDDHGHQKLSKPEGSASTYVLAYGECRTFIDRMRSGAESDLSGNEKDGSLRGSIGAIYQGFDEQDLYPSAEEKVANLLYFVVKDHSFSDGSKRIAAGLFLRSPGKNASPFVDGRKQLGDSKLVAVTIMIAESRPEEKEAAISLVMDFLAGSRSGKVRQRPSAAPRGAGKRWAGFSLSTKEHQPDANSRPPIGSRNTSGTPPILPHDSHHRVGIDFVKRLG